MILYEKSGISPVGQHLFYDGRELVADDNTKTLKELEILAGSTLYLQCDKRGHTKSEKEQYEEHTAGALDQLMCCLGDDPSTKSRVENGFGGSWLMQGTKTSSGASGGGQDGMVVDLCV